ncbi:MAG: hypothetical protein ABIS36_22995 [Chryseolinea sp.]
MKKIFSSTLPTAEVLMVLFALLFNACTSSDDSPQPSTNQLKITGTSNYGRIYIDDEITLTGTGFSGDKTSDTVDIGIFDTGKFRTFSKVITTSSSPTSISIKVEDPAEATINMGGFQWKDLSFRVRSKGAKSELYSMPVRGVFQFTSDLGGPNTQIKVGEKFLLIGNYFSDQCKMKVYINRCGPHGLCQAGEFSRCECDTYSELMCSQDWELTLENNGFLHSEFFLTIPPEIFDLTNVCGLNAYYYQTKMKLVNEDGKEWVQYLWIWYGEC